MSPRRPLSPSRPSIRRLHLLGGCVVLLGIPADLAGQERPEARVGPATPGLRLDGRLEESEWAAVAPLGPLTMVEPEEGRTPRFATEVRVLADRQNLYIGVRAFDPDPAGIVSFSKARDSELRDEDHVKIVVDPFLDGQSGYVFAVNPGGARYDALVAEQGLGENRSWDAAWEAATTRDEAGWTVEIRIPVQSINFQAGRTTWGFNLERRVQRALEVSRWSSPERAAPLTQTSRAGRLTGLPALEMGVGATIRPSISGSLEKNGPDQGWRDRYEPSLDIFQRIGSNVTAVATWNTDFAETEVDTRRTNLTRFPLFFEEKRSFFLDGADIFDFGAGMTTFHRRDLVPFFTRRIGLVEGRQVPLRGGGKVSGRVGRTSFGGLVTGTGRVRGLVEATRMGALRVKQNVLDRSSVGILGTFGDPLGRGESWMMGGDAVYNTSSFLGERNLIVGFWGLAAGRAGLEGDRSAMGGIVDYPNDVWDLWLSWKRIGEAFDPSLGFVPRRGVHLANAGVNYRLWTPGAGILNLYFELVPIYAWNLRGDLESYRIFTAPLNVRFESGDRIEFNVQPQGERLPEPFEIADGVVLPVGSYDWVRYRAEVDFATKRPVSGRLSWWFGPFYDGRVSELSARVAVNSSDLVNVEFTASRNEGRVSAGRILQQVLGTRVQVNFSPDLQVSTVAQYQRETDDFGVNARLRWTFDPLGDLFVIYNHNTRDEELLGWRTQAARLSLKLQYAFRY